MAWEYAKLLVWGVNKSQKNHEVILMHKRFLYGPDGRRRELPDSESGVGITRILTVLGQCEWEVIDVTTYVIYLTIVRSDRKTAEMEHQEYLLKRPALDGQSLFNKPEKW